MQGVMLTKERIKDLIAELTPENITALIRCEAGLEFVGKPAVGRIRELELIEKASWKPTEDGRQVVGALIGVPYKPRSRPAPSRSSAPKAATSTSPNPNGKFKPRPGLDIAEAEANRDSICLQCREVLPKGSRVAWIADEGMFHTDCVDRS